MTQHNTTIEDNSDPLKYEVGRVLRFIRSNPQETVPCETFSPGDIIRPMAIGDGMGISCMRADGACDMVWPEEVELA